MAWVLVYLHLTMDDHPLTSPNPFETIHAPCIHVGRYVWESLNKLQKDEGHKLETNMFSLLIFFLRYVAPKIFYDTTNYF